MKTSKLKLFLKVGLQNIFQVMFQAGSFNNHAIYYHLNHFLFNQKPQTALFRSIFNLNKRCWLHTIIAFDPGSHSVELA